MSAEFMTTIECAELLRTSPQGIRDLVHKGIIPHKKLGTARGSRLLFSRSEIDEWMTPS